MDRYFKGLEVGKYVKRSNWSITQYNELFLPDANTNHGKEDDAAEELQSVDPEKVRTSQVYWVELTRVRSLSGANDRPYIGCQSRNL